MKPRPKPQDSGTQELFRAKLKNIINLGHELVRLGELSRDCRTKRCASGGSGIRTCNIFAGKNIFSTPFRWSARG